MERITLDQLNAEIAKPNTHVTVSFNTNINHATRAGSYVTVQRGLSVKVFFVGRALDEAADVIEVVG